MAYAQIPRTSRSRRHRAAADWIQALAGDRVAARELVDEVQRAVGDRGGGRWYLGQHIADLVRVSVAVGQRTTAEALTAQAHDGVARNQHGVLTAHATLAEAAGALEEAALRYDEAAAHWAAYGHRLEQARALLGAGRCLLALGRPEGQDRLRDARTVLVELHAEPLLNELATAVGDP